MAQNYLPAGPSVSKPAHSPAQAPGDTHTHPMVPKTTRPQPAGTKPDPARQQLARLPNTIPPPSTSTKEGKRPPDPGFPWTSQPAMGDEVFARQAFFSRTWYHAVVTTTQTSGRHTTCDIRWNDSSHTCALPLSRVRRLSSDAPLHTADPPQPVHQLPSITPLSNANAPTGTQRQRSPPLESADDPPLGTLVDARQSRHSQWYPATILSHDGPHNRRTSTVRWLGTSDDETSSSFPRSWIRAQPPSPPPPLPASAHHSPHISTTPPDPPSILVHLRAPSPHGRVPAEQASCPAPLPRPGQTSRRASRNKTNLVPIAGTPSSFGPPHNTPTIPAPSIPMGAPVLTVSACWAAPILMGLNTWEIRVQNALKRGTIYIAISGLSDI